MRRAAKTDSNQDSIVDALRAVGCSVVSLAGVGRGVPDLLVHVPEYTKGDGMDWTALIEVKNPAGKGSKLTPAQVKFHAEWNGPIITATTPEQALRGIGR